MMQANRVTVGQCSCLCRAPVRQPHVATVSWESQKRSKTTATVPRATAEHGATVDTVISLPLFPLPSVLHPAQMGQLLVHEPRYLSLFRDLQAAATPGSELQFGHILAAGSAPPILMQDSVGGLPNTGACATVKSIEELSNGYLQIKYQGVRRFKLLAVDHDQKPYPVAAATWLDDVAEGTTDAEDDMTAELERDVYGLLQQVIKYSQKLAPEMGTESSSTGSKGLPFLPDTVLLYAPPPPDMNKQRGVADYMVKAGGVAGAKIATWQRMGSVYGNTSSKRKLVQDPYQMARDKVAGRRRQELFSFAAAQLLELGLPERVALLQCKDTSARLQFVAAAVQPYLADLIARASVKQAIAQ